MLGSEMKSDFTDQESDLLTTYVLSLRSGEMPKVPPHQGDSGSRRRQGGR